MERRGRASVLERPLSKGKAEVSLSAFAFLFSELVQYADGRGDSVMELEHRLAAVGWQVGTRMHELMAFREWGLRRLHSQPEQALSYIRTTVWKALFGKPADQLLQQGAEGDGQCTCYHLCTMILNNKDIAIFILPFSSFLSFFALPSLTQSTPSPTPTTTQT